MTLREETEARRQAEQRQAEEAAAKARRQKTVVDLWDRYSKEVVAVENKPRTAAEKIRIWERRIQPAIGAFKVNDVTTEDAGAIVRTPLRIGGDGQVIGGKAEAGNLYRLLHHLFSKALGWDLRSKELGNPLETITEPKVQRRERLMTGAEIGALLRALDTAATDRSENPQVVAAIRATVLTGARINELLNLRWENVRPDDLELHLADTKTGPSRRPISAMALAVLTSVERMPGVPFVFRGLRDPTSPLSYSVVRRAFQRLAEKVGLKGCSLHTLRHWFATMTANSVSNPRVGMALTGHRSHSAYLNYVHGNREQARALAEQLAELAHGLAAAGSNVTSMRKGETS